ncbi:MAG: hypothetical protein MJ164_01315 [Alphaproteobacteria bacterium]|nr:hypothetical protein [Alphaproteobacteria bacterium]
MKKYNKIFTFIIATLMLVGMTTSVRKGYTNSKTKQLRQKIEKTKSSVKTIPQQTKQQERDSIAHFNAQSAVYQELTQKRQEKQKLQTEIANLTEKSMSEYWKANFPKYKRYIYSKFTDSERTELSKCVNNVHFTLSCNIDTNYYKTLDEILYGPYWHEFIECATEQVSEKTIKKYEHVRKDAEYKYPYIFIRSVFYDGGNITTTNPYYVAPYEPEKTPQKNDSITIYNKVFTGVIQEFRDSLLYKNTNTASYMNEFNKFHNVSKIFTANLDLLIETPFVFDGEHIDLQSPLFKKYADQILQKIKQIIVLTPEIKKLDKKHEQDVNSIQEHFKELKEKKIQDAKQTIEKLGKELQEYDPDFECEPYNEAVIGTIFCQYTQKNR